MHIILVLSTQSSSIFGMFKAENRSWTPWLLVDVFYGIQFFIIMLLPSIWWLSLIGIQSTTSSSHSCMAYNEGTMVARLVFCVLVTFFCLCASVFFIRYCHQRTLISPRQERQFLLLFSGSMASDCFYLLGQGLKLLAFIKADCWMQEPTLFFC